MIVYKIENFLKGKVKIYVKDFTEDQAKYINSSNYLCFLYTKELFKYKIKENEELSDENFNKIIKNQYERTNNKCVGLLERSFKTKKDLERKLILAGYNQFVTLYTIDKMEEYGYVNDREFAEHYFESYKNKKSISFIKQTLKQKGVSSEIIEEIIDNDFNQDDIVMKLIDKKLKGKDWDDLDFKEKYKIKSYIYSKGYKLPSNLK